MLNPELPIELAQNGNSNKSIYINNNIRLQIVCYSG